MGRRTFTLRPTAAGRFRIEGLEGRASEVEVEGPAPGARPRLRITTTDEDGDIERAAFEPVELWSPSAAELEGFAGSYASEELDTAWRFAVVDGRLFVRHRGLPEEPLKPTIAGVFTLEDRILTFAHGAGGRVSGFTLDAGRVRGIAFRKQPAG
jgi:hypothetical protein